MIRFAAKYVTVICLLSIGIGCGEDKNTSSSPPEISPNKIIKTYSGKRQNKNSLRGTKGNVRVELSDKTYEFDLPKAKCKSRADRDIYLFSGVSPEYDLSMVLNKPTFIFGLLVYDENRKVIDSISINRTDYHDQNLHQINGRQFQYSGEIQRGLQKQSGTAKITLDCVE